MYSIKVYADTPPEIIDVSDTPDPQVSGGFVNITCDVSDDIEVDTVKVDISGPVGFTLVNTTMNVGSSYYYNTSYTIVGTYDYFIWANDTSGNSNMSGGHSFVINPLPDAEPPEIGNVTAVPDLQVSGGFVNISCNVIDNEAVDTVSVNISGPTGFTPVNITMIGGYYYNSTYSIVGSYSFFIWANDTNNNINISSNFIFEIRHNNQPVAYDDYYSIVENTILNVTEFGVLENDTDSNNDEIIAIKVSNPTNGTLIAFNPNGTFIYEPNENFSGIDSFIYKANDGFADSNNATVHITITTVFVNNPPYTPSNPYPANGATNVGINAYIFWTGGDPDGDSLKYDVYFGASSSPSKVVGNQSANFYDPGTMSYEKKYYWKIVAWDDNGDSTIGPIWKFTTEKESNGGGITPPTPPISNNKPVANASAGEPYIGFVNEEIIFDGSLSYDPDEGDSITQWLWYFGDGKQGTGEKEGHIFSSPGEYKVILIVTDKYGAKDDYETIARITQPNRPPSIPIIEGPTEVKKNIYYNYSAVSTDLDNDTIKYTFEWGDGEINESEFLPNGTPFSINHSWTKAGKYVITVTVTDRKTTSKSVITVDIDIHTIDEIGFLIDVDGDGVFDVFHNTTNNQETIVKQDENGNYLIDTDNDGNINYIYNLNSNSISPYTLNKSEGSSLDFSILITVIIVVIIVVILIVFLILLKSGIIYIEKTNKGINKKK